jgi:hypothetical protein
MSTGDPHGRPRVVRQPNLFGGTDVLSLYGRNGRIRMNRLHCASDDAASRVVQQSRHLERAEAGLTATPGATVSHDPTEE